MGGGKGEEEPLPTTITNPQSSANRNNADSCYCCARVCGLFRFRCVFVLVLGLSVLLSAVFWLPPFLGHGGGGDHGDLDLDSHYKGHDIVATFMVQKPLYLLQDDFPQLGGDIFDEIRVPTTKVVIITAESIAESNTTKVIFGVDPDEHNSKISPYAKSLIRASFVPLVLRQQSLSLTESLFGESSSFEVLKFVGGITVTPPQRAYPLQKVQIQFNFTLNFSIEQILDNFEELTSQLKLGLHLSRYENLYVSLSSPKGSTVAPPTTVQSSVVLVVGTPSMARLKQLTQTIKGSPTKNLGLNNTQFGKVKQISLSSIIQHPPTPSPSPLPQPSPPPPQPTHDNHHHHQHHHHSKQLPPAKPPSTNVRGGLQPSPAPSPIPTRAPHKTPNAQPPDCHSGYNRKKRSSKNRHPPLQPPVSQPVLPPPPPPPPRNHPPPPPRKHLSPPPPPKYLPPPPPKNPPPPPPLPPPPPPRPPPPPVPVTIPASSPLPNVVFAHTRPPSKSDSDTEPPDMAPSGSNSQPSSCAGAHLRAIPMFLVIVTVHLLLQQK